MPLCSRRHWQFPGSHQSNIPEKVNTVLILVLAAEEEVHAPVLQEALAVPWGLISHVPHGAPR